MQHPAPSVTLATGGYDRQIRFWSPQDGSCRHHIMFPDSQINRLAISPQKNVIAAAGNPCAKLFDIHTSNTTFACDSHSGNITSVGFQRLGRWFYTGSEDATVNIWDQRVKGARRTSQNDSPVNDVVLHPNQAEIISVCRNGTIRIWDLAENKIRKTLGGGKISSLQTASIMGDGSVLVAADQSGQIHVWDAAHDYKYLRSFQAHKGYVLKSLFSPNLKYLATTSSDTTVKIWSTKDLKFKCNQTLASHRKWVWDCSFSADSSYLLTASSDCSAKLWELQRGIVIRQFTQHHKAVVAVALNDTDKVGTP